MTHDELNLTRQVANMIRTAKGKETDQASDIIAVVRAAEQRRIREALLGNGVDEVAAHFAEEMGRNLPMMRYEGWIDNSAVALTAALAAIGLGESEVE